MTDLKLPARVDPLLLASLIFLMVSGLTLGIVVSQLGAGVPVYCSSPVHDHGRVRPKSQMKHQFEIQNRSNTDVEKIIVASRCSKCSSASADRDSLSPGDRLRVNIVADAGEAAGIVQREFVLVWRLKGESSSTQTRLAVRATVVP